MMAIDGRPGLDACRIVMNDWVSSWEGRVLPILVATETEGGLRIRDTRRCAVAPEQDLSGPSVAVLAACEVATTAAQIVDGVARASGAAPDAVQAAIEDLKQRKLAVELDGRLVSLVLRDPVMSLTSSADFPGGWLNDYPIRARNRKRVSLAAE
jgi:magnesium-protoporphyrin IX monomethyl ester (oxidative) cyclase